MAKFSGTKSRPQRTNVVGPISTTTDRRPTFEGGDGWVRDPESELFLLAVTNMVGEDTFYEDAASRDERFSRLVHQVAQANPDWIAGSDPAAGKVGFAEYLRSTMNMRSAAVVMACEYAAARGPNARGVLARALQRADEPAEAVGYWLTTYGRSMPMAFKRGVADAAARLYTERSALRYDGQSRGIRMADVIDLVHPRPRIPEQSSLFKYLLDKRHNRTDVEYAGLPALKADAMLLAVPEDRRREFLRSGAGAPVLVQAGWSWERLSGWLPGGMDAEAWEWAIPQMGYMALIRNLRNFDEAGVSAAVKADIARRISDAEQVERSRQFPFRFWSAFKFAPSLEWAAALEAALDHAVRNIPALPGRTLVLIDTSGSMDSPVSDKSKVQRYEVAALFGAALAKRCGAASTDVAIFGSHSRLHPVGASQSVLRYIESVGAAIGSVGHGTMTWAAVDRHYVGHDRVVIFTDEQSHDSYGASRAHIPTIHTFNLAGYRTAMTPNGEHGRYAFGGFTDATFTLMKVLEDGKSAGWPFA